MLQGKYSLKKKFVEEEVPYPRVLNLELTTNCNLKCVMCPKTLLHKNSRLSGDISQEVFKKVVEQVIPRVRQVILSFIGEPLMKKNYLYRLMKVCSDRRIAFSLVTNGLLMDKGTSEYFVENRLLELNVSVDAANEKVYRGIRGGDFKKLVTNLKTLRDVKEKKGVEEPYVKLTFVVMKKNVAELKEFVRLAAMVGAREVVLQSLHPIGPMEKEQIRISTNGNYHYFVEARDLGNKLGVKLCLTHDLAGSNREFHVYKNDSEDFVCRLPWTTIYIDRFGGIRPCCGLPPLGNILKTNLDQIWFGDGFKSFREKLALEYAGFCRDCPECSSDNQPLLSHLLNLSIPRQLGNGWYHPEVENEQKYRWTSDKAYFYLKPNGGKTFLMEYQGFKNGKSNNRSLLRINQEIVSVLDHSDKLLELPISTNGGDILRFEVETNDPVIPWMINENYPDPRMLGLKIGFAAIIHPYNFENKVKILHVDFPQYQLSPNSQHNIRIYWKILQECPGNVVLFLHCIHDSVLWASRFMGFLSRNSKWFNSRFFQADYFLSQDNWKRLNGMVKSVFNLNIPAGQKPGNYKIFMGCWNPGMSPRRWKTMDDNPSSFIHVGTVNIV